MLKVNNRLKNLKNKPMKRLRADIWGTLGLKNKKNQITKKLKEYLEQDFKFKIKKYTKLNKTKAYMATEKKKLFTRVKIYRKRPFFVRPEFDFNVVVKAREKRRKRVSYRGAILKKKRLFITFFGSYFNRKKLRKITKHIIIKRNRFRQKRTAVIVSTDKNFGHIFGSRLDLTLFRSNFCTTMRQCKQLIKHKKVRVMFDNIIEKFFTFKLVKISSFRVPLFSPVRLITKLQIKRKNDFRHSLLKNNVYYARPKDLFIDYLSFISLRIIDTNSQKLSFGDDIKHFAGMMKYS